MNQARHYCDLLDWIAGPVQNLMTYVCTLARYIRVAGSGAPTLKWRNGAMRSINVTMLGRWKNLEGSITILKDRESACIGSLTIDDIKNWEFVAARPMNAEIHATCYQTNSACVFGHPRCTKSP